MLDANAAIAAMDRTDPELTARLMHQHSENVVLSSITAAELFYGVEHSEQRGKNMEKLMMFRARVAVVSFDEEASRHFGQIHAALTRRGVRIGPMDTLIAAHARSVGSTLVTANTKEFRRVPGLKLENWSRSRR